MTATETMTIAQHFGFTDKEMEIIRDRLGMADCVIPAVHNPEEEDVPQFPLDTVSEVYSLLEMGEDWSAAVAISEPIAMEIIHDCLGGSTWCAKANDAEDCGEITKQQLSAIRRTYLSAVRKFEAKGGKQVDPKLS